MNPISQKLHQKFFTDPDWAEVEKLIMDQVNPLIDMSTIDIHQPAEHVKAEIIGRTLAYEKLTKFLEETGIVTKPRDYPGKNIFK